MKTKLGLLFLILLFGCNLNKHISEKKSDCVGTSFKSKFIDKDSLGIPYYQSNEFAEAAIKEYTIESVKKKFSAKFKLTLVPTVNVHDSKVVDTIYKFSSNHNLIEFYRAKHADFVIKFDVTDKIFKLSNCISIGSDKNTIVKDFEIKKNIGDTIVIGNLEQTTTFTLYFRNNKIVRIVGYNYID
jgi:hypothetical protein